MRYRVYIKIVGGDWSKGSAFPTLEQAGDERTFWLHNGIKWGNIDIREETGRGE